LFARDSGQNTRHFEKHALRCVNLATSKIRKKTHLKACYFAHLYLANTHLKECKNTHLFRKIDTLSCVKKHALRCVNLATEWLLKIHTLYLGKICGQEEALCILLKMFAYPCTHSALIPTFSRPISELALNINRMTSLLFDIHGHRLTEWNHQILHPEALETYMLQLYRTMEQPLPTALVSYTWNRKTDS
jgi:hypothetical protein